jgi:nucleoside phosphorylase
MRHYPHLRISARGPEPSGTSTHLTRQLSGTHYVVVRRGKSLAESLIAAKDLIEKDRAKRLIMLGVAGSLGRFVTKKKGDGGKFRGPGKGDVVVAAAAAPYRIREKVREVVENAGVPFDRSAWMIIPTDPGLFRLAHIAGDKLFGESTRFHEGLIVTGNGIKDALKEKHKILDHFPGGLAVEEEGYLMALLCMVNGIPFLNIRGISDFAQGDKKEQKKNAQVETTEQVGAGLSAAKLAVRTVQLLSQQW